jgi:hypothetical protein
LWEELGLGKRGIKETEREGEREREGEGERKREGGSGREGGGGSTHVPNTSPILYSFAQSSFLHVVGR